MITIAIENYRGCASAKIECDPIALVGGRNAAGKSSLAQGVGTALCGKLPVSGRNAGNLLVRAGTGSATIEVSDERGKVRMVFPSGQSAHELHAPEASEYASGLDSIVNLNPRDRARVLSDALHAEPNEEDLTEALAKSPIKARVAPIVWREIEARGWDGAHATYRDKGAKLKGMWQATTGVAYGSRVAAAWRPDLADLDEAELDNQVRIATMERDRAIAAGAVSDAERQRVVDEAARHAERLGAVRDAETAATEAAKAYAAARNHRAELPPAEQTHSLPCPYCDGPIVIERDLATERLLKATGKRLDDDVLKKRRMAIAEADGAKDRAEIDLFQAQALVAGCQASLGASIEAKERIANWPRAIERTISAREADELLANAQKRLAECRAKKKADEINSQIEAGEIIIGLLAGDGLRAQKLGRVLDVFNAELKEFSEAARWQPVSVGADMTISYAARPYALLSGSEQFRVRVVLQIAMARLEGASMVVVDAADILDGPGRSWLIALLGSCGIPALVCMTLSRVEQLPDLGKAGLGRSYWIEHGHAELLQTPKAA